LAAPCADAIADHLVEVTAYTLNIRAAPSANAQIVGLVNKHDQLVVRPVSDSWAAVLHGTEITGFVSRKYIRTLGILDETTPTGIALVPALFAILLIFAALALLLFRSRKRTSSDSGSNFAARETRAADTRLPEPHEKSPQGRRSFRREYLEDDGFALKNMEKITTEGSWRRFTYRTGVVPSGST
jgi:hypothetical protein